jgi:hypothetical protein
MLQRRQFRIVWISKAAGQALDPEVKSTEQVSYSGKRINIIYQHKK